MELEPGSKIIFDQVSLELNGTEILEDMNFTIRQGELLVILGSSGCGKSSTVKLINGLLLPTRGRVLVSGVPTLEWDPVALRRRIGYVIQETGLFPHYTVERNIGLIPKLEGWDSTRIFRRVEEMMELLELDSSLKTRYPGELSGGQKQRVGVARAFAADPPVLLMDEPFGAVDPLSRLKIRRKFKDLHRTLGKTTVFVTHDVHEAFELASRIGLMANGRLLEITTPEGFLNSDSPEVQAFVDCLYSVRPRSSY
jgi:osmoprotectant transport system ATP-binding protein